MPDPLTVGCVRYFFLTPVSVFNSGSVLKLSAFLSFCFQMINNRTSHCTAGRSKMINEWWTILYFILSNLKDHFSLQNWWKICDFNVDFLKNFWGHSPHTPILGRGYGAPPQTLPPSALRRFAPPRLSRDLRSLHRRAPPGAEPPTNIFLATGLTDRRTDGQTDDMQSHNRAQRIASRGENTSIDSQSATGRCKFFYYKFWGWGSWGLMVGRGLNRWSGKIVFLYTRHFLFTCQETCCMMYSSATTLSVTGGRTDTRRYDANSQSYTACSAIG